MDGYGNMSGWGWAGMSIGFVLFWGLVIAGVVYFLRNNRRNQLPVSEPQTPREVLDKRLARGEISPSDYRDSMAALSGSGFTKQSQ